jgi:nucleoside 2-deoxyribosyltransferase
MTKLYFAGPLFSFAEQSFNAETARFLESRGFEVWLPQEHEPRTKTAVPLGNAVTRSPSESRSSAIEPISGFPAIPKARRTISC